AHYSNNDEKQFIKKKITYNYTFTIITWTHTNTHKYVLSPKKHCEQNDAVLATVNNQQNVTQLLETVGDGFEGNVWIGLNVTFTEWRWSLNNGSATFTHWGTGEPNNYNGPELCVSTYHGLWNDYPCSIKNFFLCYDNSNKIGA
uniref:C-type lectin domain-containing protein n=1 Tax=Salarias fasciatus TaxID=181472 RepID=A0A672J524_SALFA